MKKIPQLTHYRIDDLPLVLGMLMQMGIPHHYDSQIGDHGLHTGLSGGWMLTIWLAFILTKGDHTKYKVEDWVARHKAVIEKIIKLDYQCNQQITPRHRLPQRQCRHP